MKQTRLLMGMPITIQVDDPQVRVSDIDTVYDYFTYIDNTFSTYKKTSEITKINKGVLKPPDYLVDMQEVLQLSEQTKRETNGYFDIVRNNVIDPSGIVKGWAIYNASQKLKILGFTTFYIDAGGDIEACGKVWKIGIRNPFNTEEIVKVLRIKDRGVATSGIYERGQHIYNPLTGSKPSDIASITVIGPNIYEADRFATAAYAMGENGIQFIEKTKNLEGYMIDSDGVATQTSGFENYV